MLILHLLMVRYYNMTSTDIRNELDTTSGTLVFNGGNFRYNVNSNSDKEVQILGPATKKLG